MLELWTTPLKVTIAVNAGSPHFCCSSKQLTSSVCPATSRKLPFRKNSATAIEASKSPPSDSITIGKPAALFRVSKDSTNKGVSFVMTPFAEIHSGHSGSHADDELRTNRNFIGRPVGIRTDGSTSARPVNLSAFFVCTCVLELPSPFAQFPATGVASHAFGPTSVSGPAGEVRRLNCCTSAGVR